jgi:hypothetical protein
MNKESQQEAYYEIASMSLREMLEERGIIYKYDDPEILNAIQTISKMAIHFLLDEKYNEEKCCTDINTTLHSNLSYYQICELVTEEANYLRETKKNFKDAPRQQQEEILDRHPDYLRNFITTKFAKPNPIIRPVAKKPDGIPDIKPQPLSEDDDQQGIR